MFRGTEFYVGGFNSIPIDTVCCDLDIYVDTSEASKGVRVSELKLR